MGICCSVPSGGVRGGSPDCHCPWLKNSVSGSFRGSARARETTRRFCVSRPEDGLVCALTTPQPAGGRPGWENGFVRPARPGARLARLGAWARGRVLARTVRSGVPAFPSGSASPSTTPSPRTEGRGSKGGREEGREGEREESRQGTRPGEGKEEGRKGRESERNETASGHGVPWVEVPRPSPGPPSSESASLSLRKVFYP